MDDSTLPIVDAHLHFRDRPGDTFLLEDLVATLGPEHAIAATVAVECGAGYLGDGPSERRPLGEIACLQQLGETAASMPGLSTNVCAGIVGYVDLRLGARAEPLIADALSAGKGRLRGIRNPVAWHPAPELRRTRVAPAPDLLSSPDFLEGAKVAGRLGLSLDAWLYHTQLPDMAAFASRLPETTIVIDHLGGPLGYGPYEGRRHEVFAQWRGHIRVLSRLPNVVMKLSGFGHPLLGLGVDSAPRALATEMLAEAWTPYVDACIEAFGVERCMFASNYPSDRPSLGYNRIWTVLKRVTRSFGDGERSALFHGTATRVYRLTSVADGNSSL